LGREKIVFCGPKFLKKTGERRRKLPTFWQKQNKKACLFEISRCKTTRKKVNHWLLDRKSLTLVPEVFRAIKPGVSSEKLITEKIVVLQVKES